MQAGLVWDAVPGDPAPCLFIHHCEGESLLEGFLQPGQQLPGLLAVRKVGFKHTSLKWLSWSRVTLLVRQKAMTQGPVWYLSTLTANCTEDWNLRLQPVLLLMTFNSIQTYVSWWFQNTEDQETVTSYATLQGHGVFSSTHQITIIIGLSGGS